MPGVPLLVLNACGVLCIAIAAASAAIIPGVAGGLLRSLAVFAVAALVVGARRRLAGTGTAYIDDLFRDLGVYLALGGFATLCAALAARFIGGPVGPGWPAAVVFLIGPTDGAARRMWGVKA